MNMGRPMEGESEMDIQILIFFKCVQNGQFVVR